MKIPKSYKFFSLLITVAFYFEVGVGRKMKAKQCSERRL